MKHSRAAVLLACCTSACSGFDRQSAVDPAGPQAESIEHLFVFMVVIAVVVYIAVIGATIAIIRRRKATDEDPRSPSREASAARAIKLAIGVVVPVLFVLLVYDFSVGRSVNAMTNTPMLTVELTGHRWWWEVQYEDPIPQNRVRTANELHIPVGRPVNVKLASHDVIHSFWVPNLAGKKDLIPGHVNEVIIQADKPGVYRAQCAEFCGAQHANMSMMVVAESPERFSKWIARQRQVPAPPVDTLAARGQTVFEGGQCAMCHAVASTRAAASIGPDLTHVASRLTIAAGTLKNTTANLGGWIVDPQGIKPGVDMPSNALSPTDLRALLAYLRTLQ